MATTKLTADNFHQAADFIRANARQLDKALFDYHFAAGDKTAVTRALAPYQNDDGGFGNALEPDFRLPASSPMATSVGLQILNEIKPPLSRSLYEKAVAYLAATCDRSHHYWPATYEDVNDYPHAFWWHVDDLTPPDDVGWPNPSAELLGYLYQFRHQVPADLLAEATTRAWRSLDSSPIIGGEQVNHYNLLAWQRATPHLPPEMATAVVAKIQASYHHWGPQQPADFQELNIIPFAPAPDAIFAQLFPDLTNQLLDGVIAAQAPDGGWWPSWQWGQYDDVWPVAEKEWAGKISVDTLRTLGAFGKIA